MQPLECNSSKEKKKESDKEKEIYKEIDICKVTSSTENFITDKKQKEGKVYQFQINIILSRH